MMRKPSLILACLTLLGGALSPLYGSATGDEDAITGVTLAGMSALEAFNRDALFTFGPQVFQSTGYLNLNLKFPKAQRLFHELRSSFAAINGSLSLSSDRQKNHLTLSMSPVHSKTHWSDATPTELCYDQLVEHALTKEPVIFGMQPMVINDPRNILMISPIYHSSITVLVSQGPIEFDANTITFKKTLIRTPTGLFLAPHPDMPAPFITGINLYPKIFYYTEGGEIHQSRTMCLEGSVDFQRGVFDLVCCDVEKIEVIFAKRLLNIIQRDALVSHGLTPTPSLTSTQMGEAVYALALAYRDGKEGHPKDAAKAKALFTQYIEMFADPAGAPFPALYGKAHHNLGTLAYNAGDFSMAAKHYARAAGEGFEASNRNLLSLRIYEEIPSTPEERFLAICDYHGYSLPVERAAFRFDHCAPNADGSNSSDMGAGLGMCFKTMLNTAPGVLRAPVIWITQSDGLTGDGRVESHLLVVGHTRIPLTS